MANTAHSEQLLRRGVEQLRAYLEDHKTEHLRDLADTVVALRGASQLGDGRPDWSGRSTGYRHAMASLYTQARVPSEQLDTVQAALRYHVGNLLREKASADELAAVGLKPSSPRERLTASREVQQAQRAVAAPRQDVARLAAYANALLNYIDESKIGDLAPERIVASRLALEAAQARAEHLLDVVAHAGGQASPSGSGRHRVNGRH